MKFDGQVWCDKDELIRFWWRYAFRSKGFKKNSKVILHHWAMRPKTMYSMTFQKYIGPDMFSWIRFASEWPFQLPPPPKVEDGYVLTPLCLFVCVSVSLCAGYLKKLWTDSVATWSRAQETLDRTMHDLRHNDRRMGGVTLALAGDLTDTASHSTWNQSWWTAGLPQSLIHLKQHSATQPNDQHASASNRWFICCGLASNLLKLGNGAMASENQDGTISMNNIGKTVATLQQLQDAVFPNVAHNFHNHKWLCQRAILAPKMMQPIPQTEAFYLALCKCTSRLTLHQIQMNQSTTP